MADVAKSFVGLPIGLLIGQPIIEVAKGQAALCDVYLDQIYKLAFENGDPKNGVNLIKFTLNRPVIDEKGVATVQAVEVEAPILSLVPIPAFTMEEATVQFTMEVKEHVADTKHTESVVEGKTGFNKWGIKAEFSGKVTNSSDNVRQSDHSAKYDIFARAAQHPPTEGMAKLTNIFASVIEPIRASGTGGGGGGTSTGGGTSGTGG